jgi:hypothetical protein
LIVVVYPEPPASLGKENPMNKGKSVQASLRDWFNTVYEEKQDSCLLDEPAMVLKFEGILKYEANILFGIACELFPDSIIEQHISSREKDQQRTYVLELEIFTE